MIPEYHSYEMSQGHGLKHDPLLSIVGPRPIGWISTLNPKGVPNLAPYSFFNLLCREPPLLGFAPNGMKDSWLNAQATGEFVWNLVSRPLAEAMNMTSNDVPEEVDEFELAGLTPCPSTLVAPARVQESLVSIECKVSQIVPLKHLNGEVSKANLVLGQIVAVHIARDLVVDGVYDTARAQPILRGGSRGDYFEILRDGYFYMDRPEPLAAQRAAAPLVQVTHSQG